MRTTLVFSLFVILWVCLAGDATAADHLSNADARTPAVAGAPPLRLAQYNAQPIDRIKFALAALATGLIVWRTWRTRQAKSVRGEDAALGLLAVASAFAWWNFGQFHHPHYIHMSETLHYYMGARYFPELGYTRLYDCIAVADSRAPQPTGVRGRNMRDLSANTIASTAAILAAPETCTKHFSQQRWQAFERDVAMFRDRVPTQRWNRFQLDHGYNATPVWTLVGQTLAAGEGGSWSRIEWLTRIDPLLVALMWGFAGWAFGWRAMAVGVIYWGTCYPGQFDWTGGGFLRQGWLAATIVAVCLMRREHFGIAGFLIATAALLRVFPAVVALPIGIQVVSRLVGGRKPWLSPEHRRLLLGAACALAVLLPASTFVNGANSWGDFVDNSRLHLDTPLLNYAGLQTLVAFSPDTRSRAMFDPRSADPLQDWKHNQTVQFEQRSWLFAAAIVGLLVLLYRSTANADIWALALMGIAAIPIFTELTSYYLTVLCGLGLAAARYPAVGAALCALAASGWLFAFGWPHYDEHHALWSACLVGFTAFAIVSLGRRGDEMGLR